jgi:hypothetical protein
VDEHDRDAVLRRLADAEVRVAHIERCVETQRACVLEFERSGQDGASEKAILEYYNKVRAMLIAHLGQLRNALYGSPDLAAKAGEFNEGERLRAEVLDAADHVAAEPLQPPDVPDVAFVHEVGQQLEPLVRLFKDALGPEQELVPVIIDDWGGQEPADGDAGHSLNGIEAEQDLGSA